VWSRPPAQKCLSQNQSVSAHHGMANPSWSSQAITSLKGVQLRQPVQNDFQSAARPHSAKRLRRINSNSGVRDSSQFRHRRTVCLHRANIAAHLCNEQTASKHCRTCCCNNQLCQRRGGMHDGRHEQECRQPGCRSAICLARITTMPPKTCQSTPRTPRGPIDFRCAVQRFDMLLKRGDARYNPIHRPDSFVWLSVRTSHFNRGTPAFLTPRLSR